jgi:hypothetical protein
MNDLLIQSISDMINDTILAAVDLSSFVDKDVLEEA